MTVTPRAGHESRQPRSWLTYNVRQKNMKHHIHTLLITIAILGLAGCATMPPIAYTPEVRKMSYTDATLFRDSLNGVYMYDHIFHPKVTKREVVKIEVIVPYDNVKVGLERWIVSHDGQETSAYIVKMIPDGRGGTDFNIGKDDGNALRGVPALPPPQKGPLQGQTENGGVSD